MSKEIIFDEESEMAVLGCCLEDDGNIPQVFRILDTKMFYSKAHQIIFDAIQSVYSKEKTGDVMLVAKEIKAQNQVNRIGGLPYLYDVLERTVDVENADLYAEIVKENYMRRRLVKIGQKYKNMAYEIEKDIVDVVDEATESLTELTVKPTKDTFIPKIMHNTFDALLEAKEKMESGEEVEVMEMGFHELDMNQTVNQRGTMLTITADSGVGKSILIRNIVLNRFRKGYKSLMFTTEISSQMTSLSFYSILTGIKFDALKNAFAAQKNGMLSSEQWSKVQQVHAHVDELEGWVESGNVTIEYIKNRARELKMEKGLDCLVADYVQNIYANRSFGNRPLEIDYIVNQLASLAEELDIHVIVVSQLTMKDRRGRKKRDAVSGEGAWSGGIRNSSSCMIQLRNTDLDPRLSEEMYDGLTPHGTHAYTSDADTGRIELMEMKVVKDRYAEFPQSYGAVFLKPYHIMREMSKEEKKYFYDEWLDTSIDFQK